MSETSQEERLEISPAAALIEKKEILNQEIEKLNQEIEKLNEIFYARMTKKVEDVLAQNSASALKIFGCRGNRVFLMGNENVRTQGKLVSDETMNAIKKDLEATGCVSEIGSTTDDQYGFTKTIDFDLGKLDD